MIPIRCHTCSKIIGTTQIYEDIKKIIGTTQSYQQLFIKHNIIRYCCKTILITHVPLLEKLTN